MKGLHVRHNFVTENLYEQRFDVLFIHAKDLFILRWER
jgi:hypothetical protein